MLQSWQHWNRAAKRVLWVITLLGVIAAIPLGVVRWTMEGTSNKIEYIYDYSDLIKIASYQASPEAFLAEQLSNLKSAGIDTMAVYESRLSDLESSGSLKVYTEQEASLLQGKPLPLDQRFTYLLFAGKAEQEALGPMIQHTFENNGIVTQEWSFQDRPGMILQTPYQDATLKTMAPDPLAMKSLHDQGFRILPRLSDRIRPYNQDDTEDMLKAFKAYGVTRILFDGNSVKGFGDQAESRSLNGFAELLNRYEIGLITIEGLKKPQAGLNTLAKLTHYNITRLYSLSDNDAATMKPSAIVDRFFLAAKERGIRMFFLNGAPTASLDKGRVVDSLHNIEVSIGGENGAIKKLSSNGFPQGEATAYKYTKADWETYFKIVVSFGAVSLIALLVGAFFPNVLLVAFVLVLLASGGLYVTSPSVMEQGLALGAAISAPTIALIWATNRIRAHTTGISKTETVASFRWIFPSFSVGHRLRMSIVLFIMTSLITMMGIPFVFGLLNDITYSLVLQQFRGVGLLHLAPIVLVALYVLLFTGQSAWVNIRKLLSMNITVLWVLVATVVGAAGLYYLARTGNSGDASSTELMFRGTLEKFFGVRPRTKEFLFAHPFFLLGIFLSLRYRGAWVLLIVASMGQLSMVDTFAHIHTPLHISLIRILLGLGLGAVIGLVMIVIWQVAEVIWRRWLWKLLNKANAL